MLEDFCRLIMKSIDPSMLSEVHTWTMHATDTMFERAGLCKYITIIQTIHNEECMHTSPTSDIMKTIFLFCVLPICREDKVNKRMQTNCSQHTHTVIRYGKLNEVNTNRHELNTHRFYECCVQQCQLLSL
jgi:hypothetical protein